MEGGKGGEEGEEGERGGWGLRERGRGGGLTSLKHRPHRLSFLLRPSWEAWLLFIWGTREELWDRARDFGQNMRRLEEREGPKCAVKSPTKNNFEYRIEAAVSWMGGRIEINRLGCCRDLT